MKKVSVLLPAYNESSTIANCIKVYASHPSVGEVIVVANGCTDNTVEIARLCGANVIELKQKR